MAKRRIVVTSRGQKLDLDALKASQPQAIPIVTGRGKTKPVPRGTPKNIVVTHSNPRIKGTIPATHPKESQFLPSKVVSQPEAQTIAPAPAAVEAETIVIDVVDLPPAEVIKVIEEAQKSHKKVKD